MGKIIVIGSQKGGVGKTTTTHNLAYSLKELGKKVLTVDFDSQANLTTCYGVEDTGALEYTIGHLMMDQMEEEVPESFEDYIQSREGVDYIPSSIYLSVVDAKLRTEMGAERMLAEVLEPLKSRYDYILIDTCPSLGMLPDVVEAAIQAYREDNDWLGQFLEECCEIAPSYKEKSGELYQAYRAHCMQNGEYIRSTTDFYSSMDKAGYNRIRKNTGVQVVGLKLKEGQEFLE